MNHKQTIIVTHEFDVPDGYELTGEFRPAYLTEFYLTHPCHVTDAPRYFDDRPRFILRKLWQPPACIPDGVWVYKYKSIWHAGKHEPFESSGGWSNIHPEFNANRLAELHGETFTPPPVDKIQVKRAV